MSIGRGDSAPGSDVSVLQVEEERAKSGQSSNVVPPKASDEAEADDGEDEEDLVLTAGDTRG